jgi:hypothetical protein
MDLRIVKSENRARGGEALQRESRRSPDERCDIGIFIFSSPAYRSAHAGCVLLAQSTGRTSG